MHFRLTELVQQILTDLLFTFADYKEFTQLLDQQATIDQYAEWASNLVNRCVLKVSTAKSKARICRHST